MILEAGMRNRPDRERGYSLTEALVVVAIIGIVSLVTVPNFISMYRSSRFRATLRQFTSDIRGVRQDAVSKNIRTMLSFVPGTGTYKLYQTSDPPDVAPEDATWDQTFVRVMSPVISFSDTSTVANLDSSGDDSLDIILLPNGSVQGPGDIYMRTTDEVPFNEFLIRVSTTGKIKTEDRKW